MAQLEEIAEFGSPLTAQRLSGKIVAESGFPHSTEALLEEGCGTGSPHGSETRWKKVASLAHTRQLRDSAGRR